MINRLKKLDVFSRNIIIVFAGTSLVNFFNLLYQLLIAHKLKPPEFASFNSLLSIFMLISSPLGTIQIAVTKYCSEFNAHLQENKIRFLISDFLKKASILACCTLLFFCFANVHLMRALKIESESSGIILAVLIASGWLVPVFSGAIQGLEFFGWLSASSVVTGALKLLLAFTLITLGYNIAGALGALLLASIAGLAVCYFPLKRYITFEALKRDFNYGEIIVYLFPVAVSYFCFIALVSSDMVLVKYYFTPQEAGVYSLAQMTGKIFLFLPGAISMVMFPRTSGLRAKNMDTISTLKRSLAYVCALCAAAAAAYNLFPSQVLMVLTGKAYPDSIALGRLFSISMSFFTLLYILITYFLSVKDLRFVKYLALFTVLQLVGVMLFHGSLFQVQIILCINAVLLFLLHLLLVFLR